MNKRLLFILLFAIVPLTGCFDLVKNDEEYVIIDEESEEQEKAIISPNINTPENYYRAVLQEGSYRNSEARGLVPAAIKNRNDITQLEIGLMELATTRFPQSNYYFQEGQISGSEINEWLKRYDPNLEDESKNKGLNPALPIGEYPLLVSGNKPPSNESERAERVRQERELHETNPTYLSHVMEHNYYKQTENGSVELAGVVLGVSLNSVYYYRIVDDLGYFHDGEIDLEDEAIEAEGKRIAQDVLQRVRNYIYNQHGSEVPIVIALFQEERRQSIIPGNFIALTTVEPGKKIEKWEKVNEKNYFFPSSEATQEQRADANAFASFKEDLSDFFSNFVGVVGKGRYKNDQLQELTIEINLQSSGKAEIIAMTQHITDRLQKNFHPSLPISVYINSLEGPESIVVRYSNKEPFVHIYR